MSDAISAFGTLLKMGDGGTSESFTTIAEVSDIKGPKLSLDPIDVTNHSSAEAWREFVGGLLDAGEVSLSINFMPADATHDYSTGIISKLTDRGKHNFQMVFPDDGNTTWSFTALVTAFESSEPIDDKLAADVTLKITGKPTLA